MTQMVAGGILCRVNSLRVRPSRQHREVTAQMWVYCFPIQFQLGLGLYPSLRWRNNTEAEGPAPLTQSGEKGCFQPKDGRMRMAEGLHLWLIGRNRPEVSGP